MQIGDYFYQPNQTIVLDGYPMLSGHKVVSNIEGPLSLKSSHCS